MTFDNQLKDAKEKQLVSRITKDVVFILLGITFLVISIFHSIKDNKVENKDNKIGVTTTIKK